MLYRWNTLRSACPVTVMATTSGTPAPTRLVTAEWRVSWNTTPLARSYGMPSASQVRRKCVARDEHVPLARIGLRSGTRVFTEDRREAGRGLPGRGGAGPGGRRRHVRASVPRARAAGRPARRTL